MVFPNTKICSFGFALRPVKEVKTFNGKCKFHLLAVLHSFVNLIVIERNVCAVWLRHEFKK